MRDDFSAKLFLNNKNMSTVKSFALTNGTHGGLLAAISGENEARLFECMHSNSLLQRRSVDMRTRDVFF